MGMHVAITGASGFIGSYTVKALHAAGHTVRALVRPTSRREHIAPYVAEWREGDAADPQAMAGLVAGGPAAAPNPAHRGAPGRPPLSPLRPKSFAPPLPLPTARPGRAGRVPFFP